MKTQPDNTPRNPICCTFRSLFGPKSLALAALALALVLAGASCSRFKKLSGMDKQQKGLIKVLSPHNEGIQKEMAEGFKAWYKKNRGAEMNVEWVESGGASNDLKFIDASFAKKPEGIGIDVFYGGGADRYIDLAARGLLQPCAVPKGLLSQIPETLNGVQLYDPGHTWYGVSLGGFGILVNKQIVAAQGLPPVRTWEDLADPRLRGWVEIADPRQSSSSHAIFEILLQHYGWRDGWILLGKILANCRATPGSSTQVPQDVAAGQIAYGLTLDSYAYTTIADNGADKIGFVMPEDATAVTPDPIAVLKGAPHAKAACDFVHFSLSPEGQKLWILKQGAPQGPREFSINKMVVLPSVYKNLGGNTLVMLNPYEMPQAIAYDAKKGAARLNLVDELAGAFYMDPHEQLAKALNTMSPAAADAALAPPLTEDQALDLAAHAWLDPVKKDAVMSEWKKTALNRYQNAP